MTNKQMDMTAYREWLHHSKKKSHLEIALKNVVEIDHPRLITVVLRDFPFGVWSGWSM
jgi:hypothetical protein